MSHGVEFGPQLRFPSNLERLSFIKVSLEVQWRLYNSLRKQITTNRKVDFILSMFVSDSKSCLEGSLSVEFRGFLGEFELGDLVLIEVLKHHKIFTLLSPYSFVDSIYLFWPIFLLLLKLLDVPLVFGLKWRIRSNRKQGCVSECRLTSSRVLCL